MRILIFVLAAFLLTAAPAVAQDSHGRSRVPPSSGGSSGSSGGGEQRRAAPRDSSRPPQTAPAPAPAPRSGPSMRAPQGERRAVPRSGPPPRTGDGYRSYGYGRRYYNNFYYYPRGLYPYGYGAFGLGYFYYDPYYWGYWGAPYAGYPYYGGYYPYFNDDFDIGEVRLQVHPRDAEVYVNGYYAGRVDNFDGYFQGLRLPEGGHHISIRAPGYQPLEVDIYIVAGRKQTFHGDLRRFP